MVLKDRTDALQSKVFRCRKRYGDKQCAKTVSLTAGTFFYNMHLSLFTAVWLLWGFCEGFHNSWFIRHLGLSSVTVTDWLNFCSEVCMVCIQGASRKIGGYGCIVEIDESKFMKRKFTKVNLKSARTGSWVECAGKPVNVLWLLFQIEQERHYKSTSNATSMKGQLSSLIVGLHTTI